ncbi:F0F1 ATP synthase subunit A [Dyella sp.]|uniref:F0F1 ATP synthase subunit A n=1 Tax=Dyella sp. TaxID=1869338 RepID=UPI002D78B629|nr:F0F1 ATP synthase subunit A [Dyella sp.]HET7331106.1 F0F1 ATP synthase subunit A [Dyella sp.]
MEQSIVLLRIGSLLITDTVVTSWGIMAALTLACWLITRRLKLAPDRWQSVLEAVVLTMRQAIEDIAPEKSRQLLPFIGSLWIYLVFANLAGLIPGLHSPSGQLSVTAGLAILVFAATHWFGIRDAGLLAYLRHYVQPNPILLPFNVISEISRTLALSIRLFGNIMSLEMAAMLVLLVAGLLVPVPLLMLHVVEALVQAYIFGVLALVYIAGSLEANVATRVHGDATS